MDWQHSSPFCILSTGSADWGDRCGGLSNGAGQCGSQDEPSYSKCKPKVPRLHCHSRWLMQLKKKTLQFIFFVAAILQKAFLFCCLVVDDWEDTTMFSFLDSRDKTTVMAKRMKYFTNNGETFLVILCLASVINTILDGFPSLVSQWLCMSSCSSINTLFQHLHLKWNNHCALTWWNSKINSVWTKMNPTLLCWSMKVWNWPLLRQTGCASSKVIAGSADWLSASSLNGRQSQHFTAKVLRVAVSPRLWRLIAPHCGLADQPACFSDRLSDWLTKENVTMTGGTIPH